MNSCTYYFPENKDKMTAETLTSSKSIVKPQENQQSNGGTTVNNQSSVYVGEPTHYFCSCIQLETYDTISMFFAEIIGTAMLLFLGCMGSLTWGAEPHPFFGALLFGLTVMLIIQSFGCVSGAHLNPAVTIAAYIYRAITLKLVFVYIVAQVIGAILGFGLLKVLTPSSIFYGNDNANDGPGICSTVPHKDLTTVQALTIEYLATTVLIIICCSVWDPRNKQYQDSIPLKFGFAIAALSYGVGPFTGCSMNPVRTLGPAVWNGDYDLHWIYWVGPISSGIITSLMYKYLFRREIKIKVKTTMNGGVVEEQSPTVISINY